MFRIRNRCIVHVKSIFIFLYVRLPEDCINSGNSKTKMPGWYNCLSGLWWTCSVISVASDHRRSSTRSGRWRTLTALHLNMAHVNSQRRGVSSEEEEGEVDSEVELPRRRWGFAERFWTCTTAISYCQCGPLCLLHIYTLNLMEENKMITLPQILTP